MYRRGLLPSWCSPVPVVVVGNITVGGAGKTPLVIALSELLINSGYSVGIVTRGYGGTNGNIPVIATAESDPSVVGDESVLLARRTNAPVAVSTNRVAAVKHLIANTELDCILCDDGLQHYALKRDIEIAVIDAEYLFGNRFCLPAGPLREPVNRLNSVDMTVYSGASRASDGYSLVGDHLVNVCDGADIKPIVSLQGKSVHAVAGIASPGNFYQFLRSNNIEIIPHEFGDHADYERDDLLFNDELPVVMTEKDMVKCVGFDLQNCWYVPVTAELDDSVVSRFTSLIEGVFLKSKNNER